jgi:hypothetical protein
MNASEALFDGLMDLFGSDMPVEIVALIYDSKSDSITVQELRSAIRRRGEAIREERLTTNSEDRLYRNYCAICIECTNAVISGDFELYRLKAEEAKLFRSAHESSLRAKLGPVRVEENNTDAHLST